MIDYLGSFRSAVADDLRVLTALHDKEPQRVQLECLFGQGFPDGLGFRLQGDLGKQAAFLLKQSATGLGGPVSDEFLDELAADFAAIYLNHSYGASPCESVWLDEDGLTMQAPMFQIRAWYARYGLEVPNWRLRTDDHLVHQLEFLTFLMTRADPESLTQAAQFLDEHLLRWVPAFAKRVAARAATALYAGVAVYTDAFLDELRDVLAEVLERPRPSSEDVAKRLRTVKEVPLLMPEAYVPGVAPSW